MVRRLILDTGVIIAIDRADLDPRGLLQRDDDVVIAAVTLAELQVGVQIAPPARKAGREAAFDNAAALYPVEDYGSETSQHHANLLVHCRKTGTPRGEIDLMIAATALATNRVLVTLDRKADFGSLPGINVIELPDP